MRTSYKIVPSTKLLLEIVSAKRWNTRSKFVFTNGCFDIFHAGHVYLLEQAKGAGDLLIVGLNSDESVKRIKGDNRPILPQDQRALIVASLKCVDYVVIFEEDTPYALISMLVPEILVKGGDWEIQNIVGCDIVTGNGGKVLSINHEIDTSSTKIIETITRRYRDIK